MYRSHRSRYQIPLCPIHKIPRKYADCQKCAEEREAQRIAEIKSLPDHITYIGWDGKERVWSPSQRNVNFFVIFDKYPTKNVTADGRTELNLEFGSVGCYSHAAEESRKSFADMLAKYSGFDWAGVNPRLVKAPCAFDAHKTHVLVENLEAA